ncbi:MAG: PilT/PilU family type 4a pilus ATPase [Candidatus Eremiobacteraeota bacterium]|nr:PilT/PilU family type 4a pilus ATPase [Candidatus Eremiobacteraeota bacterium]
MSRRKRRQEEGAAEEVEHEEYADDEGGEGGDSPDKAMKKLAELEKKIEDVTSKMGLVMMEARDAESKVKKLEDSVKDMEDLADEVDEKLEKLTETEVKIDKIIEESEDTIARIKKLEESGAGGAELEQRLKQEGEAVDEKLTKAFNEASRALEKIGTIDEQMGSIKSHMDEITAHIEETSARLEAYAMLKDGLANHTEEIQDIRKLIDDVRAGGGGVAADMESRLEKIAHEAQESAKALKERIEKDLAEITPLMDKMKGDSDSGISAALEKMTKIEQEQKTFQEMIGTITSHVNEITEELNQIDERYDELTSKSDETVEKIKGELKQPLEEQEQRIFTKIQEELGNFHDVTKTIEEASKKVEELQQKTSQYEDTIKQLSDTIAKAEVSSEKVSVAFRLVEDMEKKISRVVSPVDELISRLEDFEELPAVGELGFDLNDLLQVMIKHGASDLHLKEGAPPTVRLEGDLVPVGNQVLSDKECKYLVLSSMSKSLRRQLLEKKEIDFAYAIPEARFRVNAFLQKSTVSGSYRMLRTEIPSIEELGLPPFLKRFASINHGLILVTGPAGCGKSTTLASIVDYINTNRKLHVVTVEDPIEFVHKDKMSIVTQREVGIDTPSFLDALKASLRQDPNVILIGEMRDSETILTAAIAAETGHLVFSTLHTPNTTQAIQRIVDVFSGDQQKQFRLLLSTTLRGVISQRLLNKKDNEGRIPAVEIMVVTPTISSLIMENKVNEIYQYMVQGQTEGMQTFTAALTKLYEAGLISKEDAMYHADQPTEFRLGVEGHTTGSTSIPEDSLMSWL